MKKNLRHRFFFEFFEIFHNIFSTPFWVDRKKKENKINRLVKIAKITLTIQLQKQSPRDVL